jgi:AraC-like DNA-binding protein/quercetin dioxygenase-like cupin family protein
MLDIVRGRTSDNPSDNPQAMEVYWVARYDYHPGWAFPSHAHDFYQLITVVDGVGTARLDRQTAKVQGNSVLFMPPYTSHSLHADSGGTLQTFDVKFDVFSEDLRAVLASRAGIFDDSQGNIRHTIEQLHHEAVLSNQWYRELCNALILQAVIWVARQNTAEDVSPGTVGPASLPADHGIRTVLNYIHDHYGDSELSLDHIAGIVGYSTSYLSKKFRSNVGLSIHRYIMRYRIYGAKALLRYSEKPIKEIAFEAGFKTVHHFTRVFSELEGMPPARWRDREYEWGRKGITVSPRFVNIDITETN